MNEPPDRSSQVRPWVVLAEDDFRVASHEMARSEDASLGGITFHAQQCVEKYVKALLILHAVDFPHVHDLNALLKLVPASAGLDLKVKDVISLNRFAVESRYPGDWEPPSRKEAEGALEISRKAREAVRKCLPKESLG